jgi:hypothetical protein
MIFKRWKFSLDNNIKKLDKTINKLKEFNAGLKTYLID